MNAADFELTDEARNALLDSGIYDNDDIWRMSKIEVENVFENLCDVRDDGMFILTSGSRVLSEELSSGNEEDVRRFTLDMLEKLVALMKKPRDSGNGERMLFDVTFSAYEEKATPIGKIFKE